MLKHFLRRASASGTAAAPPPQGYGSIPMTDDEDAVSEPLSPAAAALDTSQEQHDDFNNTSWLDLDLNQVPETPSPYAAAGYQRLSLSPIQHYDEDAAAVAATDTSSYDQRSIDQHGRSIDASYPTQRTPLATPEKSHASYSSNSNCNSSTPQLIMENLEETAMHVLQGSDDNNNCHAPSGASASASIFHGRATIASEIATMTKSIVGCGVLSLPGGMALCSNAPSSSAVVVSAAIVWIVGMGAMFGYCCLLLGKICSVTQKTTFRACWQATMGHGAIAAIVVSLANATKAGLADLAYSTILSQTVQSLFQTLGWHVSRIQSLWIVTLVGILPLCLLQNLHVLAPFSVLGTFGIVLTAAAMMIRLLDGSYQPGGQYYNDIPISMQPDLAGDITWPSYFNMILHMLPFVCMLFESFVMHYNSPRFYAELQQASVGRFAIVVGGAFGLSTLIFIVIACAGFLTFGGHADGYILNNYSHRDPLATMSRLAIAVAILLTYPLAFIGLRDGVMHSLHVSVNVNVLTLLLLGGITLIACVATDLGIINAVGGGTLAMAIVFVFPALMYRSLIQSKGAQATQWQRREVNVAMVLMLFGVAIGLIGAYLALTHSR